VFGTITRHRDWWSATDPASGVPVGAHPDEMLLGTLAGVSLTLTSLSISHRAAFTLDRRRIDTRSSSLVSALPWAFALDPRRLPWSDR
jgi:hypothetical protein